MKRSSTLSLLVIVILLTVTSNLNAADIFLSAHLGATLINANNTDVKLNQTTIKKGDDSEYYGVMGIRFGAWMESIPRLGASVDFTLNGVFMDNNLVPFDMIWSLSALAMYRMPLKKSKAYPNGRIAPYIAVGPGLFLTEISQFIGPPTVSNIELFYDSSSDVGLDARIGILWRTFGEGGFYIEYRYAQFEASYTINIAEGTLNFNPTLKSHSLLFGVSF